MAQTKYSCQIIYGISDHDMVLVKCPLVGRDIPTRQDLSFPDYLKADDESILDFLDVNVDHFKQFSLLGTSSIDNVWEKFKTIVQKAIQTFVPLRVRRHSQNNPWVTRNIACLKHRLRCKRRQLKKHETSERREEVRNFFRHFKCEVRNARSFHMNNSLLNFMKTPAETFWRHLSPSRDAVTSIVENGSVITENDQMASVFNE